VGERVDGNANKAVCQDRSHAIFLRGFFLAALPVTASLILRVRQPAREAGFFAVDLVSVICGTCPAGLEDAGVFLPPTHFPLIVAG
jgi:hypothetical protein